MDTERAASQLSGLSPALVERTRELVDAIADRDRVIARAEGEKAAFLAELATIAHAEGERSGAPNGIEDARRAMAAEIAAATRTHPAAAKHQLSDAELLVDDYPATHAALTGGRISIRHARAVADAGGALDPHARAALDDAAVTLAERCTPGDLTRIVKKQAAELAPRSLRERHERERERRFVSLVERENGMSDLLLYLPTFEARAVYGRATEMARLVKADRRRARDEFRRAYGHAVGEKCAADCGCAAGRPPGATGRSAHDVDNDADRTVSRDDGSRAARSAASGAQSDGGRAEAGPAERGTNAATPSVLAATDLRTMDQLRVDLLTDLFLSSQPTGHDLHSAGSGAAFEKVNATVQVTIPVEQMIDRDEGTAWIDEGGLVSPDTARTVAGKVAGWERLFYRPDSGEIERVDHYRPTAAQRRALIGRDVTCRFPGCTTPARKADIDHTRAYAEGGETALSNLAALCESHHMMKHGSGWTPRQLPGGVIEWTSPTGRTSRDEPASRVFFRPTIAGSPTSGARPGVPRDGPSSRTPSCEQESPPHEPRGTRPGVSPGTRNGDAAVRPRRRPDTTPDDGPGGASGGPTPTAPKPPRSHGIRSNVRGAFDAIVDELEANRRSRAARALENEHERDRDARNAERQRQRNEERQNDRIERRCGRERNDAATITSRRAGHGPHGGTAP